MNTEVSVSTISLNGLEQIWNLFFKAETGTYEKSQWLDLLLAELLIHLNEGKDLSSIDCICPIDRIITLVGCELLCGIHSATSTYGRFLSGQNNKINFNAALSNLRKLKISDNPISEDSKKHILLTEQPANFHSSYTPESYIKKYILKGSAWKCLALLQIFGIESLSCSRQLSGVLIWLYSEQSGSTSTPYESNPYLPPFHREFCLHEVFANKIWTKKTTGILDLHRKPKLKIKKSKNTKCERKDENTKINKRLSTGHCSKALKIIVANTSHSSDSISESYSERTNPSSILKPLYKPSKLDYLDREDIHNDVFVSSKTTCDFAKNDPKNINDFITNRHNEVLNSTIDPFEFKQLVVCLLIKLCKSESDLSCPDGLHINSQCVDFAIKNLCTLQFESSPATADHLDSSQSAKMKALLSELLLVSLNKVLMHRDLSVKLVNSGTLPMLLRLLEDLIHKLNIHLEGVDMILSNDDTNRDEFSNNFTYLFAISYSILEFLYSYLIHNQSLENFNDFINQYKLFSECQKGLLIANSIILMMKFPNNEKDDMMISIKGLINIIGKFVLAMKNIRTEFIHAILCSRKKHKFCCSKINLISHHHQDIFGIKYSSAIHLNLLPICGVATLFENLLLLLNIECFEFNPTITYEVLKTMRRCGTCCCFSPKLLLQKNVETVLSNQNMANLCFDILEKTLYREILSSEHNSQCGNCNELYLNKNENIHYVNNEQNIQEIFYKSTESKMVWPFLTNYNELFKMNKLGVVYATMKHLLQICNTCNMYVKHDLLFCVVYPAFVTAKNRYIVTNTEISFFVIMSSLNMFSNFMCFVPFSEEFIKMGGLAVILELMHFPEFYESCSAVFEIAVDIEIFKVQHQLRIKEIDGTVQPDKVYMEQIHMLSSVDMFFALLENFTKKTFKYFKIKMDENAFETVLDLSDYQSILIFQSSESVNNEAIAEDELNVDVFNINVKKTQPINIKSVSGSHDNALLKIEYSTIENILENHIELLKHVSIFWKTCSELCLFCPLLRQYIVSKEIFKDGYKLLKLILHSIFYITSTSSETALLIKILESIVTIGLAASDSTMDNSHKLIMKLLSEVLLSKQSNLIDSQNMQSLLEMLIRLSSLHTSDTHVLPPFSKCKLAPVHIQRNNDSLVSSGDEDDFDNFEYLTEESDSYQTADEGYEADIDIDLIKCDIKNNIGDLNQTTSSNIYSTENTNFITMKKLNYSINKNNNFVKFPDICVMVVDVLLSLTEKFLAADNGTGSNQVDNSFDSMYNIACVCFNNFAAVKFVDDGHTTSNGIITQILTNPAAKLLRLNLPKLQDLQCAVLNFIYTLASHSISPSELKLYMNLFTANSLPLNNLLQPLIKLSENIVENVPDHILCFPIFKKNENDNLYDSNGTIDSNIISLLRLHSLKGIESCWSRFGVLCIIDEVEWGMWINGCSIVMWLRIHQFQHTNNQLDISHSKSKNKILKDKKCLLHILSIAHENLIIEFWIDTNHGDLSIKITNSTINGSSLHGEMKLESIIPLNTWTNLAINIKDIILKKKYYIEVSMFINGIEQKVIAIPIKGIVIRKPSLEYLLLGHSHNQKDTTVNGQYYLSNVSLYKATIIDKYNAMYLYANGPNRTSFTDCQVGTFKSNYASLYGNQLLSEIDWNQVFETSNLNKNKLQENLLLTYSAHNPLFAELYHQISTNPTVFRNRGKKIRCVLPKSISTKWMGNPLSSQYSGLPLAVDLIGGPQIFLYLFARVIELNGSHEDRACALKLLFNISFSDNRLYSSFHSENIYSMLEFIFASAKCKLSLDIMKTFLDAASNSSLLSKTNKDFQLDVKSNAIILHPHILVTLLRICREVVDPKYMKCENQNTDEYNAKGDTNNLPNLESIWSNNSQIFNTNKYAYFNSDSDLLETLFCSLEVFVRDDHPHRAFNVFQMNQVNFVQVLLLFCKERFLNADLHSLSETTSYILVELIRSLMGSPPIVTHITQLTDFFILMHKASATFITHARTNYYFLLTPMIQTQCSSLSEILGLMPYDKIKKNSKKIAKKNSENDMTKINSGIKNLTFKHKRVAMDSTNFDVNKIRSSLEESYEFLSNESQNESPIPNINSPSTSSENSKRRKSFIMMKIKQENIKREKRHRRRIKNKSGNNPKHYKGVIKNKAENHFLNVESSPYSSLTSMKEYVVIESDEGEKRLSENNSPSLCPEITSPTLRLNLQTGSAQSQTICEGLLLLLRDTILLMPDSLLNQIFALVVRGELFLILSNHTVASVRTSVVKVVCALTQRCTIEQAKVLEQMHYFFHLANQISQYSPSNELISACASLINGARPLLEDHLKVETWYDVMDTGISRSSPLLSLLPCIIHDKILTQHTLIMINYIIDKSNSKQIIELGFCEVLLKTLQNIALNYCENINEYNNIIEHLNSLLIKIYLKFLDQQNIQAVMDLYNQLSYLELNNTFNELVHCDVVQIIRNTNCRLIDLEIEYIESQLNATDFDKSGTFNKLSQVVSVIDFDGIHNKYTSMKNVVNSSNQKKSKTSRSDLISRHIFLLSKASAFLINRDTNADISITELNFMKKIFLLLIKILSGIYQQSRNKRWQSYKSTEISNIINSLFTWIMTPSTLSNFDKTFFLETIKESSSAIKQVLTPNDLRNQRKIAVYLTIAMEKFFLDGEDENSLKQYLLQWITEIQPVEHNLTSDALAEETLCLIESDRIEIKNTLKRSYPNIKKSLFNKENFANSLTESAMSITRTVVDTQNSERKLFLDHLRHQQNLFLFSKQKWQRLIETFSHEKGVWFSEDSYPNSWEIDSIEGPDRIRVRLKRCHLDIDRKFLKDEFKYKADTCHITRPLSYLFDFKNNPADNSFTGIQGKFHINECVKYTSSAMYITVNSEMSGEIVLSDRCIHFIPNSVDRNQTPMGDFWSLDSIVNIVTRRWQLRERALEIFLSSGHTHLLAFESSCEMESFLCVLDDCHMPNRYDIDSFFECMDLWRNGTMTNWKYLMSLNGLAGRSYNDLMQYPVLPFILSDYTSTILNLNKPNSFRNLHKPMAVQHQYNEIHFINNYNYLKQAIKENCLISGVNKEPYHYGSHYSNSGTILHFLVRLLPFTKLFLSYQDNNFDIPDRTFHSLQTTWKLTSCDSTTDVKELIPEFFYLPRVFCNPEGLNFGVRQCGNTVDDVILPPWAPNARLFVLIHRQALESSYVKENLPHWIDLIFGYKQNGQAAVDAVNVFHPATYYGFHPPANADTQLIEAWETMVRTYGQTPRQLLKQPHPQCITDLSHNPENTIDVLSNIIGLRWGRYCGSPQEPPPNIVWRQKHVIPVIRLIPLLTNEVIGVSSNSTLMITYTKTRNNPAIVNTSLGTLGLVTWGHPDNIIRIKQQKDLPPEPLVKIDNVDPLCVVSHAICNTLGDLWLGFHSGRILVLKSAPIDSVPPLIKFSRHPVYLYGHNSSIVSIYVSGSFGVAATASQEGLIIIWDTYNLTYLRSIINNHTISNICISETLCDIATVHVSMHDKKSNAKFKNKECSQNVESCRKKSCEEHTNEPADSAGTSNISEGISSSNQKSLKYKSKIKVHTINGEFVGQANISDKVTSICYSNAAEGVSVNAIAVGLQSGSIRLFSSWDLKPLISLIPTIFTHSIISITYSNDSQCLYAAASDGTVMIWEDVNNTGSVAPNFRIITSSSII